MKNRQDQAIIYESLKKEIEGDLEDLQNAGFKTESLEKEFKNITVEVDSNLTITPIEGSATAMVAKDVTVVYIVGIEKLKEFQKKLKKYSQIRNHINLINQNGVDSHLVDEQLIQLIAGMIDKECIKTLKENFNKCGTKISAQQADFKIKEEVFNQLDDQYNSKKKKRVKPKLVGRSLLLAGTALVGTILITNVEPAMLKNIEAPKLEQHTVTYYPTLYEEMFDGEVVASFTKDELKPELDATQIIVYSPYQADGNIYTREITTYELPATSAGMTLEELAKFDLTEVEGETTFETKEALFPSEFYEQDMIRIIRIFDEKKSYDVVDQENFEKDLEAAQAWAKALLRATVIIPLGAEWVLLIKALEAAVEEAKRKREYSKEVTAILEKMLIIFQENKELRMNFDKLYPFYERIIPDDAAAILQTKMQDVGKNMQEVTTKLEYRLKKRPQ